MFNQLFHSADITSIEALAIELGYPEPVLESMMTAAAALPVTVPIEGLSSPNQAQSAWKQVSQQFSDCVEDDGMAFLAVTTAAACAARRRYKSVGIPDTIFLETMRCIPRFLYETKELLGRWAYDRGFWTLRQTGGLLFRLGTLEFEYRTLEITEPCPSGLQHGDPVLNVHIPSDAVLQREELDSSYQQARAFFYGGVNGPWTAHPPKAILCDTWLLASALTLLLPEISGIRNFASDYQIYHEQFDSDAFYRWLYKLPAPVALQNLPEITSLQRRLKEHLLSGGHMGVAWGKLRLQ